MNSDGLYVVVVEWKNEGPMVMETTAKALPYEAARDRMVEVQRRPDVIRVAIARLQYETGNEMVLPWGESA